MSRYEFTKAHCDEWHSTPNRNPKTNRKINPKAEFGVFAELEKQCHPKQKKEKKENNNSPKRIVKTPKSPSPRVSPLSNNNSNNSINSKNWKKSPTGIHLVAQITILRNPIIEMFKDVKTCMFDYCGNSKDSDKLRHKMKEIFEIMNDEINEIQSPTDGPKTIKKIDKEIEKHEDLKKFADCALKKCGPKYSDFLEKTGFEKIITDFEKLTRLSITNPEKVYDEKIENKMTSADKKGIKETIDILYKRLDNLIKQFKSEKKVPGFRSTDILFLLPLFSLSMGRIMMHLMNFTR